MDKERIRPIVLCLFHRGGRILVSDAFDHSKGEYFCRPLGGGIEFGEHSREAMLREIREETGAEVENLRLLGVLESRIHVRGRARARAGLRLRRGVRRQVSLRARRGSRLRVGDR